MVRLVLLQGGDSDANAAVAGALLGCKLGLDAIPKSWTEPLLHRAWLDELVDRYFVIILLAGIDSDPIVHSFTGLSIQIIS